jgi:hypothetical protein
MRLRASDGVYFPGALIVFPNLDEMTIDRMLAFRGVISA